MGLHTATGLDRWVNSAEAKTLRAGRLDIGPRLILGFVFIILSMLAADAVILWQFHTIRIQAGRLNDVDQKLVAVLRVHTGMLAFHDRLDGLADAEDANRLLKEAGSLRTAVLEDIRRAMSALSLPPFDLRRDPTILPTLHVIQSALPSELEAITTLAASGDWRAVHLRLANQVRPLESLTSELVEKVDHEVSEEQAQTALNIQRVQRLVFVAVPLTAAFTLLIAAILGLAITRSITQPLDRLVEGSKALARGEFQHRVSITGKDELAHLGQVFNDTARRLRDLYATLQSSEAYLAEAQRLSHTGSFGWRPAIGEITWSDETFRIFQYDRTITPTVEFVLQRVHPEDAALVKQTIEHASQEGKDFEHEYRLLMPDGAVKHVHVVAHAERDESGEVEFVGAVMDTTESKRAEKKLLRSEESLLEAQKLSHTGSWRVDVASGAVTVSPEIYRIHDIKPDDDPSTTQFFFTKFHPEDRKRVVELFERAQIEKIEFEVDYRIVLPNGTIRHLHTIGRPILNDSGELAEFVGTAIDVTAAKQAEEALRRSESYLAEAQRLTRTGSWAWQVSGRDAMHLSEEWYRLYGFDPEKSPPPWEERLQRVHPEDRAKWQAAIDRAIAETSDYEEEFRILLPDGAVKYIHTVGHPVLNASGELMEFVGSSTDITERKRAEILLAGENRLLEMIAEGDSRAPILDAICRLVEELASGSLSSILLVDPRANRLRHGAAPSLPSTYNEAVDGEVVGPSAGSCGTAAYRAESVIVSDIATDPLWADYRDVALAHGLRACWCTPILSSAGKVLGTFAIYRREPRSPTAEDLNLVTQIVHIASIAVERKLAEETLRRSEAYLAEAQRFSQTGSFAATPGLGEIRYWSEECFRVLGFDPHGGLPPVERFFQRIHPDDQARSMEQLEIAAREKTGFEFDYRIVHPGGESRDIHTVGHPVFSPSGDLVEFVGTVIDVTERKRAEEERERLRQTQADLVRVNRVTTIGELTASLAHEVNQPIAAAVTSANSCIRWLAADVPNLDKARAAAARIVKDGTRAAEIISRIRMLFQRGTLERELADINEIIEEMIVLLRGEATQYAISVQTELAADLPPVMGDRVQLQQVMMNLMTNSIDAMKAVDGTRELAIRSQRAESDQLLVSVSDTGVGLPPGHADQIFSAFFTTKPHGTGMGLRICRSIIESHGGRLWAANNSPRGASFYLTLPAKFEARV